jgi:acyl transferase domain-containing protein
MQEPIAIIGSACRFAGDATSSSKLWGLLQKPHDIRAEIPDSRFSAQGFYHPNGAHHGHSNVMHSYLIEDDLSLFDAEFFGIKPVEAQTIDPQQRLLMEVVYEGLETAGIPIEELRGSDTSVYVGAMCHDYESLQVRDFQTLPTYGATGVGRSILANRISYFFDWRKYPVNILFSVLFFGEAAVPRE